MCEVINVGMQTMQWNWTVDKHGQQCNQKGTSSRGPTWGLQSPSWDLPATITTTLQRDLPLKVEFTRIKSKIKTIQYSVRPT